MTDLGAVRELLQELLNDRACILYGTFSCRKCAALVLNENEERHMKWHTRESISPRP